MISRETRSPLYYQLKQMILRWIDDERLRPGDRVPPEQELQNTYNLSRTTVRLALRELELEGYVVRSPGKGTFVSPPKIESKPRRLLSFSEEMTLYGLRPSSRVVLLDQTEPTRKLSQFFQLDEGERLWWLERVRLADDAPIGTEVSHFPVRVAPGLTRQLIEGSSLYDYFERQLGVKITGAAEKVDARLATHHEADLLEVAKGSPVLVIERLTYGEDSRPIELVTTVYRADRYSYHSTLGPRPAQSGS